MQNPASVPSIARLPLHERLRPLLSNSGAQLCRIVGALALAAAAYAAATDTTGHTYPVILARAVGAAVLSFIAVDYTVRVLRLPISELPTTWLLRLMIGLLLPLAIAVGWIDALSGSEFGRLPHASHYTTLPGLQTVIWSVACTVPFWICAVLASQGLTIFRPVEDPSLPMPVATGRKWRELQEKLDAERERRLDDASAVRIAPSDETLSLAYGLGFLGYFAFWSFEFLLQVPFSPTGFTLAFLLFVLAPPRGSLRRLFSPRRGAVERHRLHQAVSSGEAFSHGYVWRRWEPDVAGAGIAAAAFAAPSFKSDSPLDSRFSSDTEFVRPSIHWVNPSTGAPMLDSNSIGGVDATGHTWMQPDDSLSSSSSGWDSSSSSGWDSTSSSGGGVNND